jgi:hypothetical protein
MRYKVLYQKCPSWAVGEHIDDACARYKLQQDIAAESRYHDDYAGRVISIVPATGDFHAADTHSDSRDVIEIELTRTRAEELKTRKRKIDVGNVAPATLSTSFDDRYGASSEQLRATFADTEAAEAAMDDPDSLLGRNFEKTVNNLREELPKTITHTGAGLYKVRGAGSIATPAHLWSMETVNPVDDGTPGGNNGTGSNVTVVDGKIGHALDFNGGDSNVNVGDVSELNAVQQFTIAFWMNQDVLDQIDYIFRKWIGAYTDYIMISTHSSGGVMTFQMYEASVGANITFDYSTLISAGTWHHVAFVFDGSLTVTADRAKIYVDGKRATITGGSGTMPALSPDLSGYDASIGADSTSFDGKIDDFRVYSTALTIDQVNDVYGRGITKRDVIQTVLQNLYAYGDKHEQTAWVKSDCSVDPDVTTDFEGNLIADKLKEGSNNTVHELYQNTAVSVDGSSQYVVSADIKAGERDEVRLRATSGFTGTPVVAYDLTAGTVTSEQDVDASGIISLGSSWYRCWMVLTSTSATTGRGYISLGLGSYQGDGTSGVYLGRSGFYKWDRALYPPVTAESGAGRPYVVYLLNLDLADADLHGAWLNSEVTGTPNDASAAGDDMSNQGSPTYGSYGRVTLNGSTDYLKRDEADWRAGDSLGSLSAWVNIDTLWVHRTIFSSADEASSNQRFRMYINNSQRLAFSVVKNGTTLTRIVGTSTELATGRWYHVAVVSNGSSYQLYVDGESESFSVDVGTDGGFWLDDALVRDSITIGTEYNGSGVVSPFGGSIKDVRYYNRVLSQQDVEDIYNGGDMTFGNRAGELFVVGSNSYSVSRNGVGWLESPGNPSAEEGECSLSPYSTIQSAFDQLWTDQGSANFPASQVIRIFAGTYDEADPNPNSSMNPNVTEGWMFFVEGNAADPLNSIVLNPTSGSAILRMWDNATVRHLTLDSAVCTTGLTNSTSSKGLFVSDCSINLSIGGASHTTGIRFRSGGVAEDCTVTVNGAGSTSYCINTQDVAAKIVRCTLNGSNAARCGVNTPRGVDMESCTITGCTNGLAAASTNRIGRTVVRNSVFYDCTIALSVTDWYAPSFEFVNTVFHTCPTMIEVYNSWPEIADDYRVGPMMHFKHCVFYSYTTFAEQSLTPFETKTFAEFMAFNRVDAVGNIDGVDPLLADPAAGDFTPQANSPCIHNGFGGGIISDIDDNPFDPYHPDIGAVSTGIGPNVAYSG